MFYYFYLTRNFIGLILVLSPLAGLLYRYSDFTLSIALLCLPAAAVSLAVMKMRCSLSKALSLAVVWSVSLAAGRLMGILMERDTYLFFAAAVLSTGAGIFLFMERELLQIPSLTAARRRSTFKIMLFSAAMAFAGTVSFFAAAKPGPFDFFLPPEAVFAAGIILGPVIAALVSDSKGVYTACIFMIFMAELAAAGACTGDTFILMHYVNRFASGAFISGMPVVLPVLTFYLYDRESLPAGILSAWAADAAGALAASLAVRAEGSFFIILVFIVLIFSFFMLFSAWKHRLFLLKGRRI